MKQLFLPILLFFSPFVQADSFVIGIPEEVQASFQDEQEYVRKMYESLDHDIIILPLPGARSLLMANSGEIDGDLLRISTITEQAPNLLPVKVPLGQIKIVFFGKQGSPYKRFDDLKNMSLAGPRGTILPKIIAEKFGMNLHEVHNLEAAIRMVSLDRADLFVFTERDGLRAIADAGQKDSLKIIGEPYSTLPLFHFVNNRHKALVSELESALRLIVKQ